MNRPYGITEFFMLKRVQQNWIWLTLIGVHLTLAAVGVIDHYESRFTEQLYWIQHSQYVNWFFFFCGNAGLFTVGIFAPIYILIFYIVYFWTPEPDRDNDLIPGLALAMSWCFLISLISIWCVFWLLNPVP